MEPGGSKNPSIYVTGANLFEPISICERAKLGSELSRLEKSIHEGKCGKRRRPSQSVRRVFAQRLFLFGYSFLASRLGKEKVTGLLRAAPLRRLKGASLFAFKPAGPSEYRLYFKAD